jgi:hypothetical protein
MVTNLSRWITQGAQHTFWGTFASDSDTFNGTSDDDLAAGEESHMARLDGIINVPFTVPGAETLDFPGDNGSKGTMILKPLGASTIAMTASIEDQAFAAIAQKTAVYTDGDYDELGYSNECKAFRPMCMVINAPAQSAESATKPAAGWDVTEVLYATVDDQSGLNFSSRTAREFLRNWAVAERGKRIDGSAVTTAKYENTSLLIVRYWSPNPVIYGVYIGDGSVAQTFTVPYPLAVDPVTAESLKVIEDGVELTTTTDYTAVASTGVVTFTVAGDPATDAVVIYRAQVDEKALC